MQPPAAGHRVAQRPAFCVTFLYPVESTQNVLLAGSAVVTFKVEQPHHAVLSDFAVQIAVPPAEVIAAEGLVKYELAQKPLYDPLAS